MKCFAYLTLAASAAGLKLLTKNDVDSGVICEKVDCGQPVECPEGFTLTTEIASDSPIIACCGVCKAPESEIPLPTTYFENKHPAEPCKDRPKSCDHEGGHNVQCFVQQCLNGDEEVQCGKDACCPACGKWEYRHEGAAWNYFLAGAAPSESIPPAGGAP